MFRTIQKLMLSGIAAICAVTVVAQEVKIYESEDYFSKERDLAVIDDIYTGKGAFVGISPDHKGLIRREIVAVEFPWPGKGAYDVWVRARDASLKIHGTGGVTKNIKGHGSGNWEWHHGGRYTGKQIGAMLEVYITKVHSSSPGIDTVLLAKSKEFRPEGVYTEYTRDTPKSSDESVLPGKGAPEEIVRITIEPNQKIQKISPFLASACVTRPNRHMINDNPAWDKMMNTFFKDNILILLIHVKREPDKDGNYWNFEELDEFVAKALEVWKCKELMFLPQWWLEKPRRQNKPPTPEDLNTGEEIFMQLVRRYGGNVKYWAVCDEWTLSRYWRNNMDEFVNYYARLVRKAKEFNPELKLGGPVNAWPDQRCITKLLNICPELDFIAWNMYITGTANTPIEKLYQRTANFMASRIQASREAGNLIRQKELPVIVTAYGPNYRAWEPPDLKLAGPSNGVWQALAMSKLAEGGCFAAGSYNIQARDCGLFGPRDRHAMKGGFIPEHIDDQTIYVRPSARVMRFFQQYVADKMQCRVENPDAQVNCFAASSGDNDVALVVTNIAPESKQLEIKINGYELTVCKEFDLPTRYLYCDQDKVIDGESFIFNRDGIAKILLPPFSTQLLYVRQ